ncbi:MAG TPA: class I SAM-dependent rRNA methyltransferase, partial [Puia sp.]|nr:class I SAM-dependent rRNA methyltransferase [Puia sp.]
MKKRIGLRVENGHPWIFGNEIAETEETVKPGDIVTVFSGDKKFIGKGFINPKSQIAIRLLTRNEKEEIDNSFIRQKIEAAWVYRKKLGYIENCRLVFGEADGLPALIIDKFGQHFVIQTLALGIDMWKPVIVSSLREIFKTDKIYERNDVPVRELEGMVQQKGFLSAPFETKIVIRENGLQFEADLENGQKTGYFLDQQENRHSIRHIVKDAEVLGAFCYTGSFEVHAGHYGAKSVLGLDISENAVALATRNAKLNGLENKVKFETLNAFDVLKKWSRDAKKFDVVMLDPPAFTKSRENIG